MKLLTSAALCCTLAFSGAALATPKEGDLSFSLNPFSGGNMFAGPSASAPSYQVGYFISDTVMPYGFLTIADNDVQDDTVVGIGGGARVYAGQLSERIRTYFGGALGIVNASDTGFTLGGFGGAEAMITDGFSISGQVGIDFSDAGCDGCSTNVNLGTANVQFNFYF